MEINKVRFAAVDEYDPDQPRAKKGDPDGGQWTKEGGGGGKSSGNPDKDWWKSHVPELEDYSEGEKYAAKLKAKKVKSAKEVYEYKMSQQARLHPKTFKRSDPATRNAALNQTARKFGLNAKELARLIPDSSTVDEYNPDQPRAPKGDPDGGQWTSEGGGSEREGGFTAPGVPGVFYSSEEYETARNKLEAELKKTTSKKSTFRDDNGEKVSVESWKADNRGLYRVKIISPKYGEYSGFHREDSRGDAEYKAWFVWNSTKTGKISWGDSAPTMLFDSVEATGARRTKDGYMVAEAHVARTGIQLYKAGELGMAGDADRVIRVYRPPSEVFHADAMASYAHRPVTVDHPNVLVDAKNWKRYARGQTGDEVVRDGEYVRVPLMLSDADAINDWQNGKRELSMGYTMDLEMTSGVTDTGEQYDAMQTNLRMNHLALVSRARGGSQLRLGDTKLEDRSMDVKLTTITVDGLSVETTDAGVQAIFKLNKELADTRKVAEDSAAAHAATLAAKDKELATKDAEIDLLKGKVLSDANLDKMVKERADLISVAKQVADKDYTGMAVNDIRKAAVAAQLGQDAIDGKSEEYIAARFDILAEDAAQDPVRKVLRTGDTHKVTTVDQAHAGLVQNLENAWKHTKEVA